jgi:electron transfer flavoprotein alpha subunit
MNDILILAECRRGLIRDVTFELVTAARELANASSGRVVLALFAADPARFSSELSRYAVDEVLTVAVPSEEFEAHVWQSAAEGLIRSESPAVVLVGHTVDSLGFAAAVAAKAGLGFASDVTELSWADGLRASRFTYGDKLVARLAFTHKDCALLTVRPGSYSSAGAGSESAPVRAVDLDLAGVSRTEHVGFIEVESSGLDITAADFLFAIGRGVKDQDDVARFEALANQLGATLSVSRPLVDAGWVPSARQVGQSGKTVKPRVYLALGISGAIQHLAGMRDAGTIIAVNTDPDAPIFAVADYGAVADLYEVADGLEQGAANP